MKLGKAGEAYFFEEEEVEELIPVATNSDKGKEKEKTQPIQIPTESEALPRIPGENESSTKIISVNSCSRSTR
jgi:hypothetical protein